MSIEWISLCVLALAVAGLAAGYVIARLGVVNGDGQKLIVGYAIVSTLLLAVLIMRFVFDDPVAGFFSVSLLGGFLIGWIFTDVLESLFQKPHHQQRS